MAKKLSVKDLSLDEIRQMLETKIEQEKKKLPSLIEKRDRLQEELDQVNRTIETLGGTVSAPKPAGRPASKRVAKKRGPRAGKGGRMTLPQAIVEILSKSDGPMSPNEITTIVQKSKHPSAKSESLRLQVTTALSKRPEFKRVGRGQYQLAK